MSYEDISTVDRINKLCLPENYPLEFYHLCISFFSPYCLVVEINGEVVAYLIAKVEERVGHIISLAVLEKYRGHNIGTGLMLQLIENMISDKVKSISLYVRISNIQAIKFYRKLSFYFYCTCEKYYPDGEDAYKMKKDLDYY